MTTHERRFDLVVKLAIAGLVTVLTWTLLRPHLVITDGVPEATDPFTPFAVGVVNLILVAMAWGIASVGLWLRRARREKRRK